MKIAYGQFLHPKGAGMAFRNARFFTACEDGASEVHVFGDFPHIADAYRAKGVEVVEHDPARPVAPVVVAEAPADLVNPVRVRRGRK